MTSSGYRGTRKTRSGRASEPNRIYHVTSTTLHREPVFASFGHGRTLVRALRNQVDQRHVCSLAFVVMPDHFHWLLQLRGSRSLSVIVNAAKSESARRINAVRHLQHQLWQKGFYDRAIRREEDLEDVARYIVTNPLRAGLVKSLSQYPLWDAIWV
ncbi:MAG: transposase [Woeseiaceae bacterium]|nr:transposase [Woeseiaceae bacterium]